MRRRLLLVAALALAIGILLDLLVVAEGPTVRYASRQARPLFSCIYRTIGAADILIFGSSRVQRGIDATKFDNLVAVRLAKGTRGLAASYQRLADFLQRHPPPDTIIIEVYDSRRLGEGDPQMGVQVESRTFWLDLTSPYASETERAFSFVRGATDRLNNALQQRIANANRRVERSPDQIDSSNCGNLRKRPQQKASIRARYRRRADLVERRGFIENRYSLPALRRQLYWLEQMRALAPNARYILVDIPGALERPITPEFQAALRAASGAEVFALSESDARTLYYEHTAYRDPGHLNVTGAALFTAHLARYVLEGR